MPEYKKGAPARAKKPRWTQEQRAAGGRSTARPRGAGKPARSWESKDDRRAAGNGRPNWEPREKKSTDGQRFAKPRRDDAPRSERPRRFDGDDRPRRFDGDARPRRAQQDDRPRRDDRAERPRRFEDRGERPRRFDDRDERPRRFDDTERPRRFDRDERPRRDDRAPRTERPERDRVSAPPVDDVVLERLEAQAIEADATDGISFGDLGLGGNLVRTLAEFGATSPFPIQAATIPQVLAGRDVLGRGRTGSGKTIAFGAPLVERLLRMQAETAKGERRRMGRAPRALILAPTRELALQIDRTVQPLAQSVGLFTTQIYGGVPYARQLGAIQRGVDIVIGTPGRIGDLVSQGRLDLSQVVITVLDEADHMCELGFLEPVQELLRETSEGGQKLLYSATLDARVAALVEEFLVDPSVHEVAGEDAAHADIRHVAFLLDQRDKQDVLAELAAGPGKKLVFARTRAFAEQLADMLDDAGIRAESIHGDLNQSRRTRALEKFSNGRVTVLVATDVAARGIHVDDVELVIQADAPDEYKSYLHRAGRTGRAGKKGTVVTLVPRNRRRRTEDLLTRAEVSPEWIQVRPGDPEIGALAG